MWPDPDNQKECSWPRPEAAEKQIGMRGSWVADCSRCVNSADARISGDGHVFMSTQSARRITSLVAGFVRDDSGVDLVEYALLSALVGLAGLVLFNLSTRMG